MIKQGLCLLCMILTAWSAIGQETGGRYAFQFVSLSNSARLTGLGGGLISVQDEDVTLAYANPASLNQKTNGNISVSHQFHFADIQHTYFAYGHSFKRLGIHTHAGLHHFNYGDFAFGNELGALEGSFTASETAFVLGAAKTFEDKISVGVNVKNLFSAFESYNAYGLAVDVGTIYHIDSGYTSIGLVVKNLGGEITSVNENHTSAPLDIQIGFSKRLKYLPFRFSVIFNQLQRWNVRYDDPNRVQNTTLFGEQNTPGDLEKTTDNFFRHISFNGEFLLGKHQNLRIRGGYNHIRRRELSVESLRSLAGFSMGLGIKISYFKLDYGIGFHHLAGGSHHLSISTHLDKFKKM